MIQAILKYVEATLTINRVEKCLIASTTRRVGYDIAKILIALKAIVDDKALEFRISYGTAQ